MSDIEFKNGNRGGQHAGYPWIAVECHQQDSRANINNPTINQPLSSNMCHDALNGGMILKRTSVVRGGGVMVATG